MSENKVENAAIEIGDRVKFVKTTQRGNTIDMRTLEGVVVSLSTPNKQNARVKYHGGNYIWLLTSNLRKMGQPSPLCEMFGLGKKPETTAEHAETDEDTKRNDTNASS